MSQRVSTPTTGHERPTRRRHASLTAANASGRRSSSASPSASRPRNSTVFAASASSPSDAYSPAKRLISSTTGRRRLLSRSCFDPNTLLSSVPNMVPFVAVTAKARPDESRSVGSGGAVTACRSKLYDVSGLEAPFALAFLELDLLAFVEGPVSRPLDDRVMHVHLFPVLARNEAVAPGIVEPLHRASEH